MGKFPPLRFLRWRIIPLPELREVKRNMNISQSLEISISGEADDGELFAVMAGGGEAGFAAFGIFYRRYIDNLYERTCQIKGLAEADPENIVQETMMQAYRAAETFKPPDASLSNAAKRNKTLAWLLKIARRLHLQELRKLKADGVNGFEPLEIEDENGEIPQFVLDNLRNGEGYHQMRESENRAYPSLDLTKETESERMAAVKDFLNNLPEKKRDVITAYFGDEYDYRYPQKPLSRKLIAKLKKKHGLTSAALRQIKKRTLEEASAKLNKKKE